MRTLHYRLAAVSGAVLSLSGCLFSAGGDASADASPGAPAAAPTTAASAVTLSGTSYKGPTAAATVCAYQVDNAAIDKKGTKIAAGAGSAPSVADGCVVTGNDGTYTLALPAGTTGSLLLESSGGTYCSDESLYDGAQCAGGGLPIAMGAAKLATVVAAPTGGVVSAAPITILTTAATRAAGTLDATSFQASYAAVAGSFGVAATDPASDPKAAGTLNTVLAKLTTYLGADTSLLDNVVALAAAGTIKAGATESLESAAALTCSALTPTDISFMTIAPLPIPIWDPITGPILAGVPQMTIRSAPGLGTSTCRPSADGQTSSRFGYVADLGPLLGGAVLTGTYTETRYSDPGCATYLADYTTPMTLQYTGTQEIPLSASTDPSRSQVGTASKLTVTLLPGGTLPITSSRTEKHLFCRTEAAAPGNYNFKGYISSATSPLLNGSLSRLDSSSTVGSLQIL